MMKKHSCVIWRHTLCHRRYDVYTDDSYKVFAEDVETRFDTLNYELDRSLSKGKSKTIIGLMKGELGEKVMVKFVG